MTKKKEGENMKQDERLKDIPANSYFHDVLQRFCAHKPAMISAFVLTLEIILVIALPMSSVPSRCRALGAEPNITS